MEPGRLHDVGGVPGGHGGSTTPMHVEIDEARHQPGAGQILHVAQAGWRIARSDGLYAWALDPNPAGGKHPTWRHHPGVCEHRHQRIPATGVRGALVLSPRVTVSQSEMPWLFALG